MAGKPFPFKEELHPRREPAVHSVRSDLQHEYLPHRDANAQRRNKQINIDQRALSREKRSLRAAAGEFPLRGAEVPPTPLTSLCRSVPFEKWNFDESGCSPIDALERRMGFTSQGLSTLHAIFNAMKSRSRPMAESQVTCGEFVRLAEQVIKNHMEAFSCISTMRQAYLVGAEVMRENASNPACPSCGGLLLAASVEGSSSSSTPTSYPTTCPHCGAAVPSMSESVTSLPPTGALLAKRKRYATPPVTNYRVSLPPPISSSTGIVHGQSESGQAALGKIQQSDNHQAPVIIGSPRGTTVRIASGGKHANDAHTLPAASTATKEGSVPITTSMNSSMDDMTGSNTFSASFTRSGEIRPPSTIAEEIQEDIEGAIAAGSEDPIATSSVPIIEGQAIATEPGQTQLPPALIVQQSSVELSPEKSHKRSRADKDLLTVVASMQRWLLITASRGQGSLNNVEQTVRDKIEDVIAYVAGAGLLHDALSIDPSAHSTAVGADATTATENAYDDFYDGGDEDFGHNVAATLVDGRMSAASESIMMLQAPNSAGSNIFRGPSPNASFTGMPAYSDDDNDSDSAVEPELPRRAKLRRSSQRSNHSITSTGTPSQKERRQTSRGSDTKKPTPPQPITTDEPQNPQNMSTSSTSTSGGSGGSGSGSRSSAHSNRQAAQHHHPHRRGGRRRRPSSSPSSSASASSAAKEKKPRRRARNSSDDDDEEEETKRKHSPGKDDPTSPIPANQESPKLHNSTESIPDTTLSPNEARRPLDSPRNAVAGGQDAVESTEQTLSPSASTDSVLRSSSTSPPRSHARLPRRASEISIQLVATPQTSVSAIASSLLGTQPQPFSDATPFATSLNEPCGALTANIFSSVVPDAASPLQPQQEAPVIIHRLSVSKHPALGASDASPTASPKHRQGSVIENASTMGPPPAPPAAAPTSASRSPASSGPGLRGRPVPPIDTQFDKSNSVSSGDALSNSGRVPGPSPRTKQHQSSPPPTPPPASARHLEGEGRTASFHKRQFHVSSASPQPSAPDQSPPPQQPHQPKPPSHPRSVSPQPPSETTPSSSPRPPLIPPSFASLSLSTSADSGKATNPAGVLIDEFSKTESTSSSDPLSFGGKAGRRGSDPTNSTSDRSAAALGEVDVDVPPAPSDGHHFHGRRRSSIDNPSTTSPLNSSHLPLPPSSEKQAPPPPRGVVSGNLANEDPSASRPHQRPRKGASSSVSEEPSRQGQTSSTSAEACPPPRHGSLPACPDPDPSPFSPRLGPQLSTSSSTGGGRDRERKSDEGSTSPDAVRPHHHRSHKGHKSGASDGSDSKFEKDSADIPKSTTPPMPTTLDQTSTPRSVLRRKKSGDHEDHLALSTSSHRTGHSHRSSRHRNKDDEATMPDDIVVVERSEEQVMLVEREGRSSKTKNKARKDEIEMTTQEERGGGTDQEEAALDDGSGKKRRHHSSRHKGVSQSTPALPNFPTSSSSGNTPSVMHSSHTPRERMRDILESADPVSRPHRHVAGGPSGRPTGPMVSAPVPHLLAPISHGTKAAAVSSGQPTQPSGSSSRTVDPPTVGPPLQPLDPIVEAGGVAVVSRRSFRDSRRHSSGSFTESSDWNAYQPTSGGTGPPPSIITGTSSAISSTTERERAVRPHAPSGGGGDDSQRSSLDKTAPHHRHSRHPRHSSVKQEAEEMDQKAAALAIEKHPKADVSSDEGEEVRDSRRTPKAGGGCGQASPSALSNMSQNHPPHPHPSASPLAGAPILGGPSKGSLPLQHKSAASSSSSSVPTTSGGPQVPSAGATAALRRHVAPVLNQSSLSESPNEVKPPTISPKAGVMTASLVSASSASGSSVRPAPARTSIRRESLDAQQQQGQGPLTRKSSNLKSTPRDRK